MNLSSVLEQNSIKSSVELNIKSDFSKNIAFIMLALARIEIKSDEECLELISYLASLSCDEISIKAQKKIQ